tara:strand:- start:553 stop:726 length:174 start_codon:yes stop_codon:yes gene_type:complete
VENYYSILIDFILLGFLIYIYKVKKEFLPVYLLFLVLLIFLLPDIIIPQMLWQYYLN